MLSAAGVMIFVMPVSTARITLAVDVDCSNLSIAHQRYNTFNRLLERIEKW